MWSKKDDPSAEDNLQEFIAVAVGIDGTVQEVFGTYISFFDLLTSNHSVVDSSENYEDNNFYVDFMENNMIIETLQAPERVWALLLSDPDIFEIARDATTRPSYLRDGIRYYTNKGWTYINVSGEYKVIPPDNWSLPADVNIEYEERQRLQLVRLHELKAQYLSAISIDQGIIEQIDKEIERHGQ
jgi:hypothetical protein